MSQAEEVWKPIPGAEGRYEVSSLGRVKSLLRGERIIKTWPNQGGYRRVCLQFHGKAKYIPVHHLVLKAFIGPRPPGTVGCHANDVPDDNRPENLRWDTTQSNLADRWKRNRPLDAPARLTESQVKEILADTRSCFVIAAAYGVSESTVGDIRLGRTWKYLPRPAHGTQTQQPPLSMEYIRRTYGVPAQRGARITYRDGQGRIWNGRITSARGPYIQVLVDDPLPGRRGRLLLHPTWQVGYHE